MMKEFNLKNKIHAIYKQTKDTPRVALTLNIAVNNPEKSAGIYTLMTRLLLQGTKNRTSEQLANELDGNAIEIICSLPLDYLSFKIVCLNEDIELTIEILEDILKNTTFQDIEKEKIKLEDEIIADMDFAESKAKQNFITTIFNGHYYGNTYIKLLENIKNITKTDVIDAYNNLISTGNKIITFVGDLEFNKVEMLLNKHLGDLENSNIQENKITQPKLEEFVETEVIKPDAQQSQIFQGWLVPTFTHKDYAAIIVMNTILGASGLSSRLFLELRDKKGLAYTVRSVYQTFKTVANFYIYIATEPKNIQVSLDGFKEEIQKLKDFLVSDDELINAKNNFIGKQQFITETNSQQATQLAYYGISQLGFDFQEKLINMIKEVTPKDIQRVAQTYLNDKTVISILKP